MSTVITTNIASLTAQRGLAKSSMEMATALQRLSTGLRINSAKDDAAGMAIAERLTSQVRGFNQAIRNVGDGIALAQTAEGGMEAIVNSLQRQRELAVQAANDTLTDEDRDAIAAEIAQLSAEITRVATQTRFNDKVLLNGSINSTAPATGLDFQVGANDGEKINLDAIADLQFTAALTGVDSATDAATTIGELDTRIDTVMAERTKLGALINRFEQTITNLRVTVENVTSARSRIQDADFAAETATLTRQQILQQSGMAVLSQANQIPQNVLALLR